MTSNQKLLVGLGVAGVVVLVSLGCCGVVGFAFILPGINAAAQRVKVLEARKQQEQQEAAKRANAKSREDFNKEIMGKTTEEVKMILGAPKSTDNKMGNPNTVEWWTWRYDEKTFDPVSNKMDFGTSITFKNNKVASINHY